MCVSECVHVTVQRYIPSLQIADRVVKDKIKSGGRMLHAVSINMHVWCKKLHCEVMTDSHPCPRPPIPDPVPPSLTLSPPPSLPLQPWQTSTSSQSRCTPRSPAWPGSSARSTVCQSPSSAGKKTAVQWTPAMRGWSRAAHTCRLEI